MDGRDFVQRFDSYAEYRASLAEVLAHASGEIEVFDPDLRETGLESAQSEAALTHFFGSSREARLHIVVHDTAFIERECPRLMRLLARFSHCMEIRRSPEDLRNLTECYLLAGNHSGTTRFHRDWARGKCFTANPAEHAELHNRFRQLWELSEPAVAATQLGL